MRVKIIIITLITIFVFSCKNDKTIKITPETEQKTTQKEEHHHENEAIVFDNGKKWKVVDHMMAHIQNMEKDVNNFNGSSLDDYVVLSNKLNKNIELLTSNCTMTGQAHDELHKWLLPYLDLTNQFAEVKSVDEAKSQYQKIKETFKALNKFFN